MNKLSDSSLSDRQYRRKSHPNKISNFEKAITKEKNELSRRDLSAWPEDEDDSAIQK